MIYYSFTLRSKLNFPAKASKKVVFPDPGGPNSNVILHVKKGRKTTDDISEQATLCC